MKINLKYFILVIILCFLIGVGFYSCDPNFINGTLYLFSKDIITFALSIAGVYIAGGGLSTWRNQIEYTKKHEVADNLHRSLLKLRDAIKHVRNPAIFPSESNEAAKRLKNNYPDLSEEEISGKTYSYVYELRWDEIRDASTEVDANLLTAEVLWGREIHKLMIPLREKITELNIALKQNFQPEFRTKDYMEIHNVIYDKGNWTRDEEDGFGKKVNDSIEAIKVYINSKIS